MGNIKISILSGLLILLFCDFSRGQEKKSQTGVASYYAADFHGKRTASGEKYNMHALTAAHPSLPFDTYVKVTNLNNSKYVIVRINDRGPHTKKRIIDLSKAAAQKIGLIKSGIARVKVEVVPDPDVAEVEEVRQAAPASETYANTRSELASGNCYDNSGKKVSLTGYVIQTGSFTNEENALENLKKLSSAYKNNFYCEVEKVKGKTVYRILTGTYKTEEAARKELKRLKSSGIRGFVRKI